MRGRGNNNNRSKGPNPLSRNYESNGPDVKIRGNAQHVAEKYTTLARDAQSAGDRVMAENYLQHAEHYNRIILAAQAAAPVQYQRDDQDQDQDDENGYDDDGNNVGNDVEMQDRQERSDRQDRPERQDRQDRQDRPQRQDRQERHERPDRPERVIHQQINGSGPQPIIQGTPAEVVYDDDTVSQRQPQPQPQVIEPVQGEAAAVAEDDTAEAKPTRRAARGRRPARPRESRVTEENGAAEQPAPETAAKDLSPAGIVAQVRRRRAAVDSDV
jgi:hypothetical protein